MVGRKKLIALDACNSYLTMQYMKFVIDAECKYATVKLLIEQWRKQR